MKKVQAVKQNPKEVIRPGMFIAVSIESLLFIIRNMLL
jgi:hypothetical protein